MTEDQKRRLNDHLPAVGLQWDDSNPQPRAPIARPEQWTILLTSGNHGLVGTYGHVFPHADDDHERLNVVDEAVVIKLRERVEQLEAAVPPVSAAEQPSVLPKLPKPLRFSQWTGGEVFAYTSDQMAEYAQAAIATHLARQSPAPEKNEEILALHRALAGEKLRADQGWERAEAKSKECNELRERMAAQEVAQPMHKDVEWLVEAADMARRNPDLATKMRQNCKAGHAVQEVEPGSAPAAADEVRDAVARAIWSIRREEEDRCDMELEDMGGDHSVWAEADAAIAALKTTASAATSEEGGAA